ncbi:hypothetical protein BTO06_07130 [Tenacibaculum sp. SZ-18]|uniref:LytR/AlgR family response regulator transcription factor n=1 Tax=Tenacibaculum sp. SZ-18 TaxID=754423 RepID=UPI000C2CFA5B|nr:LytTR family DNA-binding domain-containing protein [Tenacibaculum sp. SZ-18]AUC14923.1 hypothetical protein BTO06_07130 [Tenacibaculum sp. SZ-18]
MNVVLIEDETSVAQNLCDLLFEVNPEIKVLTVLETVKDSIFWFEQNESPDIAFFDIKIADGSSFEILEKITPNFPIIFTTAFDEYALKAFKYSSIDYLLKPIQKVRLEKAILKYQNLYTRDKIIIDNNSKLIKTLKEIKESSKSHMYKKSFLVHYRNQLIPLKVEEIAVFYIENQLLYCKTIDNKVFKVSTTLEKLEQQLNPKLFFRANRQCIVAKKAIKYATPFEHRKLKLMLHQEYSSHIIISKLKVTNFKLWMDE